MASGTSSNSTRTSRYNSAVEQGAIDRTMVRRVGKRTEERPVETENQVLQRLIPGIPDEITLNHITTQLSWTDTHTLPLLSRAWNQAIQSNQVHRIRVESQSTENVVLVSGKDCIALYSMGARKFYSLPSIPGVDPCILSGCSYVCLDDRVYMLGGLVTKKTDPPSFDSGSVYILELGGKRTWRKCANMPQPRDYFVCGTLDGKIYAVGGFDGREKKEYGSLVYDPAMDAWSPIMPRPPLYWVNNMGVLGRELFVHVGMPALDVEDLFPPFDKDRLYSDENGWRIELMVLQVYNPVRNDWRKLRLPWRLGYPEQQHVFAAYRKLYVMTGSAIHHYSFKKHTWREVHSFSCLAALGLSDEDYYARDSLQLHSVLAANGELLVIVSCLTRYNKPGSLLQNRKMTGPCLLQSTGFGGANKAIVLEKVNCSLDFGDSPCMSTLQL